MSAKDTAAMAPYCTTLRALVATFLADETG